LARGNDIVWIIANGPGQSYAFRTQDGVFFKTEAGRAVDAFLSRGARYSVAGDGVVVIGAEARARLDLRRAGGWLRRWWDERRTRAELEALSDHALRDIGLSIIGDIEAVEQAR